MNHFIFSAAKFRNALPMPLLAILVLVFASSCGENLNPAIPSSTDSASLTHHATGENSRYLWGEWSVSIDPVDLSIETAPLRNSAFHWNVTGLLSPPTCPGCLKYLDLHMVDTGTISVTVELTHPFEGKPKLDAFDVKGIVYGPPAMTFPSGTVSGSVKNPDGFTARWSHQPWADINPYLDFAADNSERRFASGATHEREFIVNLPESGPLKFDFAIDASWIQPELADPSNPALSPHCSEAYEAQCDVSGPIVSVADAFAFVEISISDWQADGHEAEVSIEAPALADGPVQAVLVKSNLPKYICELINVLGAPPDDYPALIAVRDALNDPSDDALTYFIAIRVIVSGSSPAMTGIAIYPGSESLYEKGTSCDFQAAGLFQGGGLAHLNQGVQWSIDGSSNNGTTLAEISPTGTVTRLTSRWWGGTASVHASYQAYEADANLYCVDPFADSVDVQFGAFCEPGGEFTDPQEILGPPKGGGVTGGGTDVCALGYGGIATCEFVNNMIVDGDGADFIVFENAFYSGGCDWSGDWQNVSWCETAIVEVSQDGTNWFRFPPDYNPGNTTCGIEAWANPASFANLAGLHPVIASVNDDGTLVDGIDPTDPSTAGGNAFDLSAVGLQWCRYVRLIDTGDSIDAPGTEQYDIDDELIIDFGKNSPLGAQPGMAGFDCDSVAAVHYAGPDY